VERRLREGGNTVGRSAVTFGHVFPAQFFLPIVILSGACGSLGEPQAESKDPYQNNCCKNVGIILRLRGVFAFAKTPLRSG
jgi:hypothetical protein